MKSQKPDHGQCDHSHNNRADYDSHHRADPFLPFTQEKDDKVDTGAANGTKHSQDEQHKEPIVAFPDAIVYEGAVVIEDLNTVATRRTMTRPLRSDYFAS